MLNQSPPTNPEEKQPMRDTNELLKECHAVLSQLIPMHLDSIKIEDAATRLLLSTSDCTDLPDSAKEALYACYNAIMATAGMLRDRDEMIDKINESKP